MKTTITSYLLAALVVAVSLLAMPGCSALRGPSQAAEDLLILRVTWELPAEQAGVRDEMVEHVQRLDEALKSGNPAKVRNVLLSFEPVYTQLREEIHLPTPEQAEFDEIVQRLWDEINSSPTIDPRIVAVGEWVLRRLVL